MIAIYFVRKSIKKREKTVLQEATADCKQKLKETTFTEAAKASDAVKEIREHEVGRTDRQACALALQFAVLQDGVPGLLFPADGWAMKLIAKSLTDEAVQKEALELCAFLEKAADTPAGKAAESYEI